MSRLHFASSLACFLAVAFVSEPVLAQNKEEVDIPVLAHFVNWHHKRRGGNDNTWTAPDGKSKVATVPLLRTGGDPGYDSLDANIIREQTNLMAAHGITPLVSWWGPAHTPLAESGDLFLDRYFSVPEAPPIALLYEADGLLIGVPGTPDGVTEYPFDDSEIGLENARRLVEHFAHLRLYFDDPQSRDRFYRVDGRPVVFHWLSRRYRGNFARASAEARRVSGAYFIGAEFNLTRPGGDAYGGTAADVLERVRGLDAVSNYGIYEKAHVDANGGHVTSMYLADIVQSAFRWSQWLKENAPGVPLILPVQFTYADLKGTGNPPLTSTPDEALNFAASMRAIIDGSVRTCGNIARMVLVVSWNEHFEGSSIEPTKEYGDQFLRLVSEQFGSARAMATACDTRFAP